MIYHTDIKTSGAVAAIAKHSATLSATAATEGVFGPEFRDFFVAVSAGNVGSAAAPKPLISAGYRLPLPLRIEDLSGERSSHLLTAHATRSSHDQDQRVNRRPLLGSTSAWRKPPRRAAAVGEGNRKARDGHHPLSPPAGFSGRGGGTPSPPLTSHRHSHWGGRR